jgi:hypothetical protein
MLFNNPDVFFDLTLSFQAKVYYFETQARKCRVRINEYEKSAPYPQTPWGYMVK